LQVQALRTEGWTITYEEALGSDRLPSTIETTLFWVTQEALSNIRKHSHTNQARLKLEQQGSMIHLEVQDWDVTSIRLLWSTR
jgi:signal transduction histidine kinase